MHAFNTIQTAIDPVTDLLAGEKTRVGGCQFYSERQADQHFANLDHKAYVGGVDLKIRSGARGYFVEKLQGAVPVDKGFQVDCIEIDGFCLQRWKIQPVKIDNFFTANAEVFAGGNDELNFGAEAHQILDHIGLVWKFIQVVDDDQAFLVMQKIDQVFAVLKRIIGGDAQRVYHG